MDFMTPGFREALADSSEVAKWATEALKRINRDGGYPDFVVGRPEAKEESFEDDRRTLVVPIKYHKKVYCCRNELGGATLMTSDEY